MQQSCSVIFKFGQNSCHYLCLQTELGSAVTWVARKTLSSSVRMPPYSLLSPPPFLAATAARAYAQSKSHHSHNGAHAGASNGPPSGPPASLAQELGRQRRVMDAGLLPVLQPHRLLTTGLDEDREPVGAAAVKQGGPG